MTTPNALNQVTDYLQTQYSHTLSAVMILGSGFAVPETALAHSVAVSYANIPGFHLPGVAGHQGTLHLGQTSQGHHVGILHGRIHGYEGHAMADIVFPLRVLCRLGAKTLIVTNAAGGIREDLQPGDVMIITDHLNLLGDNPLIGAACLEHGPRFVDMSTVYTPALQQWAVQKAQELGVSLKHGVYCAVKGPCYETPAEVRMLRTLGADAVGMSTVPEVIAAAQLGMQVLGLSLITNRAAGLESAVTLSHEDVLATAAQSQMQMTKLLSAILEDLPIYG